ncbi:MAG: formylmethanofuran dehydrogenase subunit A [Isosphaeraceae bacterium]
MTRLRIAGGTVVDPANGIDSLTRDIWIENDRVVDAPSDLRADRTIDARGLIVMPGGVDTHCHIVGPKVNGARSLRPEDKTGYSERSAGRSRSGTLGSVPSTFATGYQYAALGYTTAVDAAVAPHGARHALFEMRDTPILDQAFLVLVGNHQYLMKMIGEKDPSRVDSFIGWLIHATRAFGIKVVNPGGVERWKQDGGNVATLDEIVEPFGATPRSILCETARAAEALKLPHPVHVHGLNLGLPGNFETTLETFKALDGRNAHFAHIQFHSYGGDPNDPLTLDSRVETLVEAFNSRSNHTLDVGQVLFGPTTSMTADGAVGYFLHRVGGSKWLNHDVELETGCGVVPIDYKDKNLIHAWQWTIGLEWFLRVNDPWRIALGTDHPNGASFRAYPELIALLMNRNLRDETIARLPKRVRSLTPLKHISREYTLSEIAIVTRAAPAKILGLKDKGHLGRGACADVTIYSPNVDKRLMFEFPCYVIKSGCVVIDSGEPRAEHAGTIYCSRTQYDKDAESDVAAWFDRESSTRFSHFAIREEEASDVIAANEIEAQSP